MNAIKRTLLVAAAALFCATPAFAGNIALTGHDDDFHCSGVAAANDCVQLKAMIQFARAGSSNPSLPVLSFDAAGNLGELTSDLTLFGIAFTNVTSGVTAAMFDPTLYSAFIVASDSTCGGCDNSSAFVATIAAQSAAITTFFNAGGGVVGLSAGTNTAYYNFVPQSSSTLGGAPSDGYTPTACGTSFGIVEVNGDPTHNHFSEPGTGGVSSLYCVAERNLGGLPAGANALTLLLQGGVISTGLITTTGAVPEPATLTLLGLGLGLVAVRRFRK